MSRSVASEDKVLAESSSLLRNSAVASTGRGSDFGFSDHQKPRRQVHRACPASREGAATFPAVQPFREYQPTDAGNSVFDSIAGSADMQGGSRVQPQSPGGSGKQSMIHLLVRGMQGSPSHAGATASYGGPLPSPDRHRAAAAGARKGKPTWAQKQQLLLQQHEQQLQQRQQQRQQLLREEEEAASARERGEAPTSSLDVPQARAESIGEHVSLHGEHLRLHMIPLENAKQDEELKQQQSVGEQHELQHEQQQQRYIQHSVFRQQQQQQQQQALQERAMQRTMSQMQQRPATGNAEQMGFTRAGLAQQQQQYQQQLLKQPGKSPSSNKFEDMFNDANDIDKDDLLTEALDEPIQLNPASTLVDLRSIRRSISVGGARIGPGVEGSRVESAAASATAAAAAAGILPLEERTSKGPPGRVNADFRRRFPAAQQAPHQLLPEQRQHLHPVVASALMNGRGPSPQHTDRLIREHAHAQRLGMAGLAQQQQQQAQPRQQQPLQGGKDPSLLVSIPHLASSRFPLTSHGAGMGASLSMDAGAVPVSHSSDDILDTQAQLTYALAAGPTRVAHPPPSRIKVVVRKRPLNKKELGRKEFDVILIEHADRLTVQEPKTKVDLTKYTEKHDFTFDAVFDEHVTNDEVYHETVGPIVPTIFERTKATCFAYGQTGSGKTYTMQPLPLRAAEDMLYVLAEPQRKAEGMQLWISFFEIYGGKLFDLLHDRNKLQMREDGKQQVCIVGLQEVPVASVDAVRELIQRGNAARSTGSTGANEESSRSHAILQMAVKQAPKKKEEPQRSRSRRPRQSLGHPGEAAKESESQRMELVGKLSFIDLAGSERGADTTDNDKQTRMEGAEINKSLLALKECIRALGAEQNHVPFRGSKLTEVLRDSFMGKSCTVMLSCISPGSLSVEHTLNTLRYTERVKALPRAGAAAAPSLGASRRTGGASSSVRAAAGGAEAGEHAHHHQPVPRRATTPLGGCACLPSVPISSSLGFNHFLAGQGAGASGALGGVGQVADVGDFLTDIGENVSDPSWAEHEQLMMLMQQNSTGAHPPAMVSFYAAQLPNHGSMNGISNGVSSNQMNGSASFAEGPAAVPRSRSGATRSLWKDRNPEMAAAPHSMAGSDGETGRAAPWPLLAQDVPDADMAEGIQLGEGKDVADLAFTATQGPVIDSRLKLASSGAGHGSSAASVDLDGGSGSQPGSGGSSMGGAGQGPAGGGGIPGGGSRQQWRFGSMAQAGPTNNLVGMPRSSEGLRMEGAGPQAATPAGATLGAVERPNSGSGRSAGASAAAPGAGLPEGTGLSRATLDALNQKAQERLEAVRASAAATGSGGGFGQETQGSAEGHRLRTLDNPSGTSSSSNTKGNDPNINNPPARLNKEELADSIGSSGLSGSSWGGNGTGNSKMLDFSAQASLATSLHFVDNSPEGEMDWLRQLAKDVGGAEVEKKHSQEPGERSGNADVASGAPGIAASEGGKSLEYAANGVSRDGENKELGGSPPGKSGRRAGAAVGAGVVAAGSLGDVIKLDSLSSSEQQEEPGKGGRAHVGVTTRARCGRTAARRAPPAQNVVCEENIVPAAAASNGLETNSGQQTPEQNVKELNATSLGSCNSDSAPTSTSCGGASPVEDETVGDSQPVARRTRASAKLRNKAAGAAAGAAAGVPTGTASAAGGAGSANGGRKARGSTISEIEKKALKDPGGRTASVPTSCSGSAGTSTSASSNLASSTDSTAPSLDDHAAGTSPSGTGQDEPIRPLKAMHQAYIQELKESLHQEDELLHAFELGECSLQDYKASLGSILAHRIQQSKSLQSAFLQI